MKGADPQRSLRDVFVKSQVEVWEDRVQGAGFGVRREESMGMEAKELSPLLDVCLELRKN